MQQPRKIIRIILFCGWCWEEMFCWTPPIEIAEKEENNTKIYGAVHKRAALGSSWHTCHPFYKEIVVALFTCGTHHTNDIWVIQMTHHPYLLPQSLYHFFLFRWRIPDISYLLYTSRWVRFASIVSALSYGCYLVTAAGQRAPLLTSCWLASWKRLDMTVWEKVEVTPKTEQSTAPFLLLLSR